MELKTEYYDLSLLNRNLTSDSVTSEAANASKRLGVAVKCSTITPNLSRMDEFPLLQELWKSPNGTIRAILDGTVFRCPIAINAVKPAIRSWEKPITVARHAYGDLYSAEEMNTKEPGVCTMTFRGGSREKTIVVQEVDGPAVWQCMHNKEDSIRSFAKACFSYAAENRQSLWFSAKDTVSRSYDGVFRRIFEEVFGQYRECFAQHGITYCYTIIDEAVSRVLHSKGGFIWACKNYDGDIISDLISSGFGCPAMMTSILTSPGGTTVYETVHGTITKHYTQYKRNGKIPTNPTSTIFAWAGALKKRGTIDGLKN